MKRQSGHGKNSFLQVKWPNSLSSGNPVGIKNSHLTAFLFVHEIFRFIIAEFFVNIFGCIGLINFANWETCSLKRQNGHSKNPFS